MSYLLLIVGLVLIVKFSDVLIDASKSLAIRFKIPKLLIALTIVAFGTCSPELAISFSSISENVGSMALANVIGSCVVNILLVIGVASIINPIKIKNDTIKREIPLLVLVTMVFGVILSYKLLSGNNYFNMIDGLILLLFFVLFMIYIIKLALKKDHNNDKGKYGLIRSILYLVLAIIVITYSASLLVDNSIIIAENLGISEKIITMIAIVVGTSFPELFLTVRAAKKGEHEMAVGNIIGTNIFNICIVMGLPITIFNGFQIVDFNLIDVLVLIIAPLLLFILSRSENAISKKEGALLVLIFILYYSYIIFV